MADIKTVTEDLEVSGKEKEANYLLSDEVEETLVIKMLLAKIDELVVAVNKLNS
jgi:hypothetical protein|tara:strand:- start:278 stop:439 length:162 start_codon:yes stop_codon:yes gene_type:complete